MKNTEPAKFYVVGNNLALDFVNSIAISLTGEDLAGWAVAAGLVSADKAPAISAAWSGQSLSPVAAFRKTLREAVEELAGGRSLSQSAINAVNDVLKQGNGGYSVLRRIEDRFVKDYELDLSRPKNILVPIAESFADLLCYGDLDLLRKCENPKCVLYFYDTTKNHRRRWCSMAICGNQAKARKFYQKSRTPAAA
jgi:predicted RNA-binding Zn ribbon-like protein